MNVCVEGGGGGSLLDQHRVKAVRKHRSCLRSQCLIHLINVFAVMVIGKSILCDNELRAQCVYAVEMHRYGFYYIRCRCLEVRISRYLEVCMLKYHTNNKYMHNISKLKHHLLNTDFNHLSTLNFVRCTVLK